MRVSKIICKLVRRERQSDPIDRIIRRNRSQESYDKSRVRERAEELYAQYRSKGVTWAACVQAVKTDWIAELRAKYTD